MVGSFRTDQNAIIRRQKLIKEKIQEMKKCEKRMKEIRSELDMIEWTEETMGTVMEKYREYATELQTHKNKNIILKFYKYEVLKNNITG